MLQHVSEDDEVKRRRIFRRSFPPLDISNVHRIKHFSRLGGRGAMQLHTSDETSLTGFLEPHTEAAVAAANIKNPCR